MTTAVKAVSHDVKGVSERVSALEAHHEVSKQGTSSRSSPVVALGDDLADPQLSPGTQISQPQQPPVQPDLSARLAQVELSTSQFQSVIVELTSAIQTLRTELLTRNGL